MTSLALQSQKHREIVSRWAPAPPETDEDMLATSHRTAVDKRLSALEHQWASICPTRFTAYRWDNIDAPADKVEVLQAWRDRCLHGDSGNAVIFGSLGVGKSCLALLAGRDLHFAGRTVIFRPSGEMLDDLRPERGLDTTAFTTPDVLIVDDLGADKQSDWTMERLYVVLNHRWNWCKPTVVTSNLAAADLREHIGARAYDRLLDGAVPITLAGESRRKPRPKDRRVER